MKELNLFIKHKKNRGFLLWGFCFGLLSLLPVFFVLHPFIHVSIVLAFWMSGTMIMKNFLKTINEFEERKKMAVQKAKLASLGEMAAGMAHEINNPLAVIHSRTLQLQRQIERNQYDPERFKEALQKINMTVERIAKIIRGLKTFSRNTEKEPFAVVPFASIVASTLELCQEKFRNNFILLRIDPVPEIKIECRESQLVQVLLNVMNNAFDAVVDLDDSWVHLSFQMETENSITVLVTDSGKGIPEVVARNIMQPFFTTKEVGTGTGLGLSISKGIVEDHEGEIYLERSFSNTRFVIRLPLSPGLSMNKAG